MTTPGPDIEMADNDAPRETGGVAMVLWQTALGIAILFVWQGVSGRLVDNTFISNPVDVARRLVALDARWIDLPASVGDALRDHCFGFGLGAVIGAALGIWLGVSPLRQAGCSTLISARSMRCRRLH